MVYLYEACDQISNFCHQLLLTKMWRKISWTDGRMDRGKTVYPPPPSGSRGIIIQLIVTKQVLMFVEFKDIYSIKSYIMKRSIRIKKIKQPSLFFIRLGTGYCFWWFFLFFFLPFFNQYPFSILIQFYFRFLPS